MRRISRLLPIFLCLLTSSLYAQKVYNLSDFGLKPDSKKNASPYVQKALKKIKKECTNGEAAVLKFKPGKYQFHEEGSAVREYYISNHDQDNPKKVGIAIEDMKNLTLDGQGADLIFHGRMLPISMLRSENCAIQNLHVDFANPHIAQIKVVENSPERGITFEPAPWVKYRITNDSIFEAYGDGWTLRHSWGIAFEEKTKRVVYNTSDIGTPTKGAVKVGDNLIHAPNWKDSRLVPGTAIAMRGWGRPTPGIFLSHNKDTRLENVQIHLNGFLLNWYSF